MLTHTCLSLAYLSITKPHCSLTNPPASDSFLLTIDIVTISRKAPRSAEWKRLQCSRGTGKGLEDCGKASIGVQGSAELQGRDTFPAY